MKKIWILLLIPLFLCGCGKREEVVVEEPTPKEVQKEEVKPSYQDLNNTPIGIYRLSGNTLTKYTTITKKLNVEEDIGIFQIFPSNEDVVPLNNGFGTDFYNKWTEYNSNLKVKLGFNIKFHLNSGEDVSYNIFYPGDTMQRWEHLMNYLYDDYANQGKGFYSHIENEDYREDTLYTAIKIQSSYQCDEIDSKIQLTVFTYDTDDDFDENGEYRGNSSYTMNICIEGIEC